MKHKFKKGDVVEIVNTLSSYTKGKPYTILSSKSEHEDRVKITGNDMRIRDVHIDHFKLVKAVSIHESIEIY